MSRGRKQLLKQEEPTYSLEELEGDIEGIKEAEKWRIENDPNRITLII